MVLIEGVILSAILLFVFYKWFTMPYTVWVDRDIPHKKPKFPFGNIEWRILLDRGSFMENMKNQYEHFRDKKIYGVFSFREYVVFIRDLELIKNIGIKDFNNFPNHKSLFFNEEDNIFGKTLIALTDHMWRDMRNILSPSFTGNKLRLMFDLINECCVEAVAYLETKVSPTNNSGVDCEVKDYFTRYTNDVIATSAFGIKVNSFKDKDNEFYTVGKSLLKFDVLTTIKIVLFSVFPKLMKATGIALMDKTKTNFFYKILKATFEYRQKHNIVRPDVIQLLLEAKRHYEENKSDQKIKHIDFNDEALLLAQCFIFFLAGYDTVSTCLCFTLYELLSNQDVQERLYEEILQTERELDGAPLNYETLMEMKYMDMVLSESLRKWPPLMATDRACTSDYNLTDEKGNFIAKIKKGELIMIPIFAIHYDEKYFKDPFKFDPERFSEENKAQLNTAAYMPFGIGPRLCIGNRLALMETKLIIYQILLKFRVAPTEKTSKDMFKSIHGFTMQPRELFWTKFIPRTK